LFEPEVRSSAISYKTKIGQNALKWSVIRSPAFAGDHVYALNRKDAITTLSVHNSHRELSIYDLLLTPV
jgi:hypothetical protein